MEDDTLNWNDLSMADRAKLIKIYRDNNISELSKMKAHFNSYGQTMFGDGGTIHIKKSHEGAFTEKAKSHGMGVQEFASHVLSNKENYPSSTIKQANFARNAAKWHDDGGSLDSPENWEPPGGWEASGLIDWRKRAGKRSDITMDKYMVNVAKRKYQEELSKQQKNPRYNSNILEAYNEGIKRGWSEDDIWGYVYNAGTNNVPLEQNQSNSNKYSEKDKDNIRTAIAQINSPQSSSSNKKRWIAYLKEKYPEINPGNEHTYYNITPEVIESKEAARQSIADKKEKERQFMEDVQERPDYEGVRKLETLAAVWPLIIMAGETAAGGKILANGMKSLGNSMLVQGGSELAGYGLETLIKSNGEGIYKWLQDHPTTSKVINYTADLGSAAGYAMDRIGEASNNDKLQATGKTLMMIGSLVDGVQGGVAGKDIQDNGANIQNVGDFAVGLLPSSWNDSGSNLDEAVRIGSQLVGVTNDAIIGNLDTKDSKKKDLDEKIHKKN